MSGRETGKEGKSGKNVIIRAWKYGGRRSGENAIIRAYEKKGGASERLTGKEGEKGGEGGMRGEGAV